MLPFATLVLLAGAVAAIPAPYATLTATQGQGIYPRQGPAATGVHSATGAAGTGVTGTPTTTTSTQLPPSERNHGSSRTFQAEA